MATYSIKDALLKKDDLITRQSDLQVIKRSLAHAAYGSTGLDPATSGDADIQNQLAAIKSTDTCLADIISALAEIDTNVTTSNDTTNISLTSDFDTALSGIDVVF